MNEATTKRPRGTRWCVTGIWLGGIAALLVVIGLLGARLALLTPIPAFLAFGVGALLFLLCIVVTVIGLLLSRGTAGNASAGRAWTSLILAILVIGLSLTLRPPSSGAPPIHDITTDLGNPPFFDAVLPLRADAPNPPEYPGNETAEKQRAAYPDLQTLTLEKSTADTFAAAEQVARDMGWEIIAANAGAGRIEATDTTFWFRFKDDVVVRLTPRGYGTYVDVRSKSRVGVGDMGTNARRIQTYLDRLSDAVGE